MVSSTSGRRCSLVTLVCLALRDTRGAALENSGVFPAEALVSFVSVQWLGCSAVLAALVSFVSDEWLECSAAPAALVSFAAPATLTAAVVVVVVVLGMMELAVCLGPMVLVAVGGGGGGVPAALVNSVALALVTFLAAPTLESSAVRV